jgi:hypothetical protein
MSSQERTLRATRLNSASRLPNSASRAANPESRIPITIILAVLAVPLAAFAQAPATVRADLGSPQRIADWTLDGSGTWEVADNSLRLTKPGVPGGAIRRPAALAVLKSP